VVIVASVSSIAAADGISTLTISPSFIFVLMVQWQWLVSQLLLSLLQVAFFL
jgi:hypothetical protein